MHRDDLYLAFADGGLTYDCQSCGKCCRNHGLADDLVRIGRDSRATPLLAFVETPAAAIAPEVGAESGILTFFTFADGCRFHGDDNLCDIHREEGAAAKPRICRLFPFSKILDIDGLWTVLPHELCPWQAVSGAASDLPALSHHDGILAELDDGFLAGVTPPRLSAVTSMPVDRRRQLETQIRTALGELVDSERPAEAALSSAESLQQELLQQPMRHLEDRDLWLDLLRCAGEPTPLALSNEQLFVVALPGLRMLWAVHFAQAEVPLASRALLLYLQVLGELPERPMRGEDLLHLAAHALPMLRLLVDAEQPLPPLPSQPINDAWGAHWQELRQQEGRPIGAAILEVLRPIEHGALVLQRALGEWLLAGAPQNCV